MTPQTIIGILISRVRTELHREDKREPMWSISWSQQSPWLYRADPTWQSWLINHLLYGKKCSWGGESAPETFLTQITWADLPSALPIYIVQPRSNTQSSSLISPYNGWMFVPLPPESYLKAYLLMELGVRLLESVIKFQWDHMGGAPTMRLLLL